MPYYVILYYIISYYEHYMMSYYDVTYYVLSREIKFIQFTHLGRAQRCAHRRAWIFALLLVLLILLL